ncbi:MAG: hypothetical protein ACPGXX_05720 [Planctomycetaceae bacterium]
MPAGHLPNTSRLIRTTSWPPHRGLHPVSLRAVAGLFESASYCGSFCGGSWIGAGMAALQIPAVNKPPRQQLAAEQHQIARTPF